MSVYEGQQVQRLIDNVFFFTLLFVEFILAEED
jgi:hypothetical protein